MTVFLAAGHRPGTGVSAGGIEEGQWAVAAVDAILAASDPAKVVLVPHDLDLADSERWVRARARKGDIALEIHLDQHPSARGAFCLYHRDVSGGLVLAQQLARASAEALGVPVRDGGSYNQGAIERKVVAGWRFWSDLGWFRHYPNTNPAMPFLLEAATLPGDAEQLRNPEALARFGRALAEALGVAKTKEDRPMSSNRFPDVPPGHWAETYVSYAAREGILQGNPDGTFRGDQPLTRYEAAALLYRLGWEPVVAKAGRGVAAVSGSKFAGLDQEGGPLGTGFHIGGGYFLTNHHVVAVTDPGGQIVKTFTQRGLYFADPDVPHSMSGYVEADVIAASPEYDLALLRIYKREYADPESARIAQLQWDERLAYLHTYKFADPANVNVGDETCAVGQPYGLTHSLTFGRVSHLSRTVDAWDPATETKSRFIQTDTPINPGNSGGPLLDRQGLVVGVVEAGVQGADGLGFAIKPESVMEFVAMYAPDAEIPWR